MKRVILTICLLLIVGCAQNSSSLSAELPSSEHQESLSPDKGPAADEKVPSQSYAEWLREQVAKEASGDLEWERKRQRQANAHKKAGYRLESNRWESIRSISNANLTELEKLHKWVQDSLASGAVHSVNVEYNEVRMDPISWSFVPIESKRIIVTCFSRYFDLKDSTGRVTIRSKSSDEKLASYSVWTGIKVYK